METFFKVFGVFLIIWIVWYLTGGPQRSTDIKPYVKFNENTGIIETSNTELKSGLVGQVLDPADTTVQINNSIQTLGQ